MTAPAWMLKHPCTGCDTGYGMCAQYALTGLMCCPDCRHPTRWTPDPYTAEDLSEMWHGHENVPEAVRRKLALAPPPDRNQP